MAFGSTLESDVLNLLLAAKAIANIADNAAAGPLTVTWIGLHTADPSSGTQVTSELSVTGYLRTSVARTTAGWVVSGSGPATASPVAAINFPICTSTSTATVTNWSIGTSSAAAGKLIAQGTLSPSIQISQNVTPQITTGSSVTLS